MIACGLVGVFFFANIKKIKIDMIYSSTRGSDINLKFGDVLLNGLAKDGGLYVPNSIKFYSEEELDSLRELDYSNLVFELTKDFVLG